MRIFEGDPLDTLEVDTMLLLKNSPDPRTRRLGVGPNADAPAIEIGRGEVSALRIVENRVVLAASNYNRRHENVRLVKGLCLQERDDGQFAKIELLLPDKCLE